MSEPHAGQAWTADATAGGRARPGWPEIGVGLLVMAVVGYGGGIWLAGMGFQPVVIGLIFTLLSGVAGFAGFAAAALLRIRSWQAFGVRRVSRRWLLIGFGAGLFAFFAKGLAITAYIAITGDGNNPQQIYAMGASGGLLSVILATLFLGIATPIGEEFLFRGVVTNALLRYGPFVGVVGSASIFALMHGLNMVLPAALVAGLVAGELFRRSGSVWPAVVVHIVFNLPSAVVLAYLAAA
jgi:membrane protease YdiL (CAAX protease family)